MTSALKPSARSRAVWVLLLVGAAALSGCGDGVGPGDGPVLREEILAHRAQWEARPFRDYSYRLRRICFCPQAATGPVRVDVRAGEVFRVAYAGSGEPVPESLVPLFPTVAGLFTILLDAVDRDAAEVEVEWDGALGYPSDVFIDYERQVADEELGFEAGEIVRAHR